MNRAYDKYPEPSNASIFLTSGIGGGLTATTPVDSPVQQAITGLTQAIEVLDKMTSQLWNRLTAVVILEDAKPEPVKNDPITGVPLADALRSKIAQLDGIINSQERLLKAIQL